MKHKLLFALLISCLSASNASIIIVHGSFAAESKWYRPNGKFFEAVKKHVAYEDEKVMHYTWSGGFTDSSIIEDAAALASIIKAERPRIVFSHSNGGNVCAYATQLLAFESPTTRSESLPYELLAPFKNTEFNETELKTKIAKALWQIHSPGRTTRSVQTTSYIDSLVLMGTPIRTAPFEFNMSVVHLLYNLYSPADIVQPIAGNQVVPHHERRANLWVRLIIPELEHQDHLPCHKHIRHALIAEHLPEVMKSAQKKDGPDGSISLAEGGILVFPDQEPVFLEGAGAPFFDPFKDLDEDEEDDGEEDDFV